MKLGVIVNPIAGMGGRVGLKGTDGPEVLRLAKSMGAVPESPKKAMKALSSLKELAGLIIYSFPGEMGEHELVELGWKPIVMGELKEETSSDDTIKAAEQMLTQGVDLIIFAGGDGTARNVYSAVGDKVPVIGIPAGVKIHSGVFANHPGSAGEIAFTYLRDMDIGDRKSVV